MQRRKKLTELSFITYDRAHRGAKLDLNL